MEPRLGKICSIRRSAGALFISAEPNTKRRNVSGLGNVIVLLD